MSSKNIYPLFSFELYININVDLKTLFNKHDI